MSYEDILDYRTEEEKRLEALEPKSREYYVGYANYWHKSKPYARSRIIHTVGDSIYLKNNIHSILECEVILLQQYEDNYVKGQLLIRFPNDYGMSILYSKTSCSPPETYYIFARILWDDKEWRIDEEFACEYEIDSVPRWGDLRWLRDEMEKAMRIGREGLEGLSAEEYDEVWKMRNRELEDLEF